MSSTADVQAGLDRLRADTSCAKVQREGLAILSKGVGTESEAADAEFAVSRGALSLITQALEAHRTDPEVQRCGAMCLCNLAKGPSAFAAKAVGSREVLVTLLAAMCAHRGNIQVQQWCLAALREAVEASLENEAIEVLLAEGGLKTVTATMHFHSGRLELEEQASALLSLLVLDGGEDIDDMALEKDYGCLDVVLGAMKQCLQDNENDAVDRCAQEVDDVVERANLQKSSLSALWAISEHGGELGATEIGARGGVEVTLSAMRQYKEFAEVQRWGASVLQSLFSNGGEEVTDLAVSLDAAEVLVKAMASMEGKLEVEERCLAALATFATHGRTEAVLSILDAGGQAAAQEAAAGHGNEGDVQMWAEALSLAIGTCDLNEESDAEDAEQADGDEGQVVRSEEPASAKQAHEVTDEHEIEF
eukprot:TRINITY_DN82325_c0_g1_i1.p1 TRINITY_DN82325_c0_g1~~TRINITY_DN82325_c0_g1_i1.p1  ORF type:complete len:420 (+),score=116.99 TRINITY_DN82325_c0_g1_i1:48-1307(+)